MNFDFSQDQKMLQKAAQALLKENASLDRVRKIMESGDPFDRDLWQKMAAAGWQGTAIPEEFGGAGFGYLELVLLAEELGASLAPTPFSSSVYLATEAILLAGSPGQKKRYLPALASGKAIGTLAFAEGPGNPAASVIQTTIKAGKLNGVKVPVLDGNFASFAVVVAMGSMGPSLAITELDQSGTTRTLMKSLDPTRPQATIGFKNSEAELLGEDGQGEELLEKLFDRAAVLIAFEQLGGAVRSYKMSLDYAKARYAFGRPIGSFQAVKHKLVDMLVTSDQARSHCYYGAWALQNSTDIPVAAAAARVAATDAYEMCSKENIQLHGGIGFTWEADPQLFFKRSKLLGLFLGGPSFWRDRLIQKLDDKHAA